MDEVLAIWNQASESVKKMIPRITWDVTKTDPAIQTSRSIELKPSSSGLPDLKGGSSNMPTFDRFVVQGSPFVRLAGLSGASAVALGAYGAHTFTAERQEMKRVYDTANFYHFVHSLALFAVPLARRPALSGTLMIGGMSIFCGTIYYHALTEDKQYRKITPYGGVLLILAWLSLLL